MNQLQIDKTKVFLGDLITTCQNDNTFKEEVIKNPKEIIKSRYGFSLKDGKNIVIEDQTDQSIIYINIPKPLDLDELELTEEQLENVAGGVASSFVCGAIIGSMLYDAVNGFVDGVVDGWNGTPNRDRGL